MTSFRELLDLSQAASDALNSIEQAAEVRVRDEFRRYGARFIDVSELREEIVKAARGGFLTAGSLGNEYIQRMAEREGVNAPNAALLTKSPALTRIMADITRNFGEFSSSAKDEKALRRVRFRALLSVQTAIRRGYTDNQIAAGEAMTKDGLALRKMWLANFVDNSPCATCASLHGTEVDLKSDFPYGNTKSPKVYEGLPGPSRHPNCHCFLVIYLVTL